MSTKTYMLDAAHKTEQAVGMGLYLWLAFRLREIEEEDFACDLAGCTANYVLCKTPGSARLEAFFEQNQSRIRAEALGLSGERDMSELLSGTAYNVCYGRYLNAGGGTFLNKYLAYIKADSRPGIPDAGPLNAISPQILTPIVHLKSLRLWRARGENPNELTYFNQAKIFMEIQQAKIR